VKHLEQVHYTRDLTFQDDQFCSFAYNIMQRNGAPIFGRQRCAAALYGLDALVKWYFS
jgi:hypothetical protein